MASVSLLATDADAAPDQPAQIDLMVGIKSLALLQNKIQGTVKVAVVYDPGNEASRADAQRINAFFKNEGSHISNIAFTPVLVPLSALDSMVESKIVVLAVGLAGSYGTISAEAARNGQLTMSTDLGCVKANQCVLGIVSEPSVEIYYSQAAAKASSIVFAQAFTMLVKHI